MMCEYTNVVGVGFVGRYGGLSEMMTLELPLKSSAYRIAKVIERVSTDHYLTPSHNLCKGMFISFYDESL